MDSMVSHLSNSLTIDARDGQDERSFQHLEFDYVSNHPCTGASLKDALQAESRRPGEWVFTIALSSSERELIENLDISASAQASFWGAKVTGSAALARGIRFTGNTVVLTFNASMVSSTQGIDVKRLKFEPEVMQLFDSARAAAGADQAAIFERFYKAYGSYIPDTRSYGATLTVFMIRSCSSASEMAALKAAMGASTGVHRVDASAATETSKKLQALKFDIHAKGCGKLERVPEGLLDLSPGQAIDWALKTWLRAGDDPCHMRTDLISIWTLPGAVLEYGDHLRMRQQARDALVGAALDVDELLTLVDRAWHDTEREPPDEDGVRWLDDLQQRLQALADDLRAALANGQYAQASTFFGQHGLDPAIEIRRAIDKSVAARKPAPAPGSRLAGDSEFKLQITGQSTVFIGEASGSHPLAVSGSTRGDVFTCGGRTPRRGEHVFLRATHGNGDKHLLRCAGEGQQIEYASELYNACQWTIVDKRGSPGDDICYGDLVMLANRTFTKVGIKSSGGKIMGLLQIRHFLRIVKPV